MKNNVYRRITHLPPEKRSVLDKQLISEDTAIASDATISPQRQARHIPLSFAKQRLGFLAQLKPHSPHYQRARAGWRQGSLNRAALERALTEVASRHQILRTVRSSAKGLPVRVAAESRREEWSIVDLRLVSMDRQILPVSDLTAASRSEALIKSRTPL